jgi:hypothetical protein
MNSAAWKFEHIQGPGDQNSSLPFLAMRAANPSDRGVAVPGGDTFGARLELPAIYVGPSGGTVSFNWRVDSELGKDLLHFALDGDEKTPTGFPHSGPSRAVSWQRTKFSLPTGVHVCSWTYTKDKSVNIGSDTAWIADVVVDNAVALASYHVGFEELKTKADGSSARWHEVLDVTPQGHTGSVLQSGDTKAGEPEDDAVVDMSLPSVEIAEPYGMISFLYRISSEHGFDMFRFLIDGVEQRSNNFPRSGSQPEWILARFRVSTGFHSLTWRYEKDGHERAGDDRVQVAEIEVRNMKVSPVTLGITFHITRISGNLAAQEAPVAVAMANIFGLPNTAIVAHFIETGSAGQPVGPNRRLLAKERRLLVHSANLYNFYSLQLKISCESSSVCRNISSTMEHIRGAPAAALAAMHDVVKQPLIQVLSVDIDRVVTGNAAPGITGTPMSAVPPVKLFHDEGSEYDISRKRPFNAVQISGMQTACIAAVGGLAIAVMMGCSSAPRLRVRWMMQHRREIRGPIDDVGSALMHAAQTGPFSDSE